MVSRVIAELMAQQAHRVTPDTVDFLVFLDLMVLQEYQDILAFQDIAGKWEHLVSLAFLDTVVSQVFLATVDFQVSVVTVDLVFLATVVFQDIVE